jgi:hypothetical protein
MKIELHAVSGRHPGGAGQRRALQRVTLDIEPGEQSR